MDRESSKALAVEISKAVDYYPNYGRDADATKAIYRAFEEDLAGYPADRIARAFRDWRLENTVMPLSCDILEILKYEPMPRSKAPEHRVLLSHENYKRPTKEEIETVRGIVQNITDQHNAMKPKREHSEPNYTHWDSLHPEAKEQVHREWLETRMRMATV